MAPADLADADRETRLNNILADYFDAVERGEQSDRERLLTRHPDLAVELTDFFTEQEQVFGLAGPLRSLIRAEQAATPRPEEFPSEEARSEISSAASPRAFGNYEVLEEMARGGMGVVYRARQKGLNRLVALKVIRAGEWASAEEVRRFRNEAEMVALLDHPHVVPVYEVGEQAGQLYFSMKLVEGGSLAEHLDRYRDDPKAAAALVATVARAVHHAHQRGVLHRDLKPSNILLDEDGRPHVTDFGLARRVATDSSLTQSGAIVGTPSYVAPEQTSGQKGTVTTATDVYGLGAVLYALLTGRPPFQAENVLETLVQVRECEPQPPRAANRRVSRDLETICLKCLAKEPQRRYASALALAEELDRFLAGQPIQARPVGVWERGIKWARRRPWAMAVGGLVLTLLVVLGGGAGWVFGDRAARQREAESSVREALEVAEPGLRQGNPWDATLTSAAQRAEAQLVGGSVGQDLRQRIEQLQNDLQMLAELERIRLEQTNVQNDHWDLIRAAPQYELAFRKYGIDMQTLEPEGAAAVLQSSAIRQHLAAGLDDWAHILVLHEKEEGKQKARILLAIARQADSEVWRDRLRDAVLSRWSDGPEQLTRSAPVEELPAATLGILGSALLRQPKVSGTALEFLRSAQRRFPADFWINHNLAVALLMVQPTRSEESIGFFRAAVALRPESPGTRVNLGKALLEKGDADLAIMSCREALALKPDYAAAYSNLGAALMRPGKLDEAVDACRTAISLRPDSWGAYTNLGIALMRKGKLTDAEAAYRKSLQIQPDSAITHNNLANLLARQGRLEEAVAANRQAIQLKPDYAEAYFQLGNALNSQKKLVEAEEAFRKATEFQPEHFKALINLGVVLRARHKDVEGEAAFRKAIEIKADFSMAHLQLGIALIDQGKLAEAEAALLKAAELPPDNVHSLAYLNLGVVLRGLHKHVEAEAAVRKAIKLQPSWAEAHWELGKALTAQGRFAEALTSLRRGHELGSKKTNWRFPSADLLQQAERLAEMDAKLTKVLKGEVQPADVAERLALASFCQEHKKLHAAAVRFYAEAFAEQPQLAGDLAANHRYNAACSSALACCGLGKDGDKLDPKARIRLRQQALDWLRADLKAYRQLMEKTENKAGPQIAEQMQHWLQDSDFASVRDTDALAKLPEGERPKWRKLWEEVEELRRSAVGKAATASPAPGSEKR